MLNKISTICSSVFLIFAFLTPGYADEHFPFLAEVSKESVNVRAGPNTNFQKIDKLSKGVQVVVLGRTYEWYKVQPRATTKAFIRADYVKIKEGTDVGEVLGDNVNIRCAPNSDAASLGQVKKGILVKVLEKVKDWCGLSPVAGTVAWIHQDFIKEVSSQVPASLMIPTVEMPTVKETVMPVVHTVSAPVVTQKVSLQGKLQPIAMAEDPDVHYQVIIDNKTIYYLKDIPHMAFFANKIVAVDGVVITDAQKKFPYPVLQINKIILVL